MSFKVSHSTQLEELQKLSDINSIFNKLHRIINFKDLSIFMSFESLYISNDFNIFLSDIAHTRLVFINIIFDIRSNVIVYENDEKIACAEFVL